MSDEVIKFFDDVHGKLETLEGRMDSLKVNIGSTMPNVWSWKQSPPSVTPRR